MVKSGIPAESVEARVDTNVGNPTGSLLHRSRKPVERSISVAERGVDEAKLVGEQALVAAESLELAGYAQRLTPISEDGEHVTEPRSHHRAVRRVPHGFR